MKMAIIIRSSNKAGEFEIMGWNQHPAAGRTIKNQWKDKKAFGTKDDFRSGKAVPNPLYGVKEIKIVNARKDDTVITNGDGDYFHTLNKKIVTVRGI